jgi:two-component system NarL family response regulator
MIAMKELPKEPHPDSASAPAQIRILIADDHPVVREGLAAIISLFTEMTVVAQAGNGREAVDLFRQHRPEMALLDLRMPLLDGVSAITAIRAEFPDARLILLTTYDGDEDIYRALRAGAKAYLLKDSPREDLLKCIREVHRGGTCIPPAVAAKLAERMTGPQLTGRELEVVELTAQGRSNKEIAAALAIAEGTVKVHLNSIFNKLGVAGRTEAVRMALERGILHLK